ncbi:MAG TPA: hypothetical protein VFL91_27175 [Thermomicrobiales bacterium]|nr:hypothetical protein [Thermomicrobiales bacterium]
MGDGPRTQRGVIKVALLPGDQFLPVPHASTPLGVGVVDGRPTLFMETRLPAKGCRRRALIVQDGEPFEDESLEHAGTWAMRVPARGLSPEGAKVGWFHLFLGPEQGIAEGDDGEG